MKPDEEGEGVKTGREDRGRSLIEDEEGRDSCKKNQRQKQKKRQRR